MEEITSLVLDVAPLQRSRKFRRIVETGVVSALEIKSTQSLACVTKLMSTICQAHYKGVTNINILPRQVYIN